MTVGMLITVLLIVGSAVFVITAFLTRVAMKTAFAGLAGGLIAALIGAGLDAIGVRLDLWVYAIGSPWHAPWPIYIAAGFLQGAVAMIYSRLGVRLSAAGRMLFIGIVAVAFTVNDYAAAAFGPKVQVIAPGIAPAFGDFLVWTIVTSIAVAIMGMLAASRPH